MSGLLITGGAGFIGSNLAARARNSGTVGRIVVLDDLSTGSLDNLAGVDVDFIEGSVTDPQAIGRALHGVDAVVHLAAMASVPLSVEQPLRCHEVNATGTLLLLEAVRARGVRNTVVASSSAVYGSNPAPVKTEREWVAPLSPYAVSKSATEQYLLAYQECHGIRGVAFRFFNVYGPGQAADHPYAAVIPRFIDAVLTGQPLTVFGDGRQTRDFVFVDTVCDVILQAVSRDVDSRAPVNLAMNTETSLLELVDALGEVVGQRLDVRFAPERPGDVRHSRADVSTMRSLFPQVTAVPLADGLRRTFDWAARRAAQLAAESA